ncbi:MAG: hypothetical protein JXL80_05115 [Planctomycetes bacterium]|nr:hypothetical protein [Planctomycetota bacterium]
MRIKARHLGAAAVMVLLGAAILLAYEYHAFQTECRERPDLLEAGELRRQLDDEAARSEQLRRQIRETRAQLDDSGEHGAADDRRAVLDLMQRCGFVMVADEPLVSAAEFTKSRARNKEFDDLPLPRGGRVSKQTRTESSLLQRMDDSAGRMVVWRSTSMATFPGLQVFFRELYRDHPNVLPLRWEIAAESQRTVRTPDGPGGPGLRTTLLLCWKVEG